MACETDKTRANDADFLALNDLVRIALRRDFEDGKTEFGREAIPALQSNVEMP